MRTVNNHSLSVFLFVLSAFLLAAAIASAGEWPSDNTSGRDLTGLTLEDLVQIPVYAASRHDQKVTEAPASVTIVTAYEIRAHGWRTLSEILNSMPGVYNSNDKSYSYVGVRGFLRPGDYNSRILVLVNGKRVNEAISGGAGVGFTMPLDVDLIDRVEFVRGPISSLYGTGSFFGVVNVITRSPESVDGVETSLSMARYDAYSGRVTCGGNVSDDIEFFVSGTYRDSEGPDLYYPSFDSPDSNNGWAQGVDGERHASLFLQLISECLTAEFAYVDRLKHNPTASWGTLFNDKDTRDNDEQLSASLSYVYELEEHWDIYALIDYQKYKYEGLFPYDWADEGDPVDRVMNIDGADSENWGCELKLSTSSVEANQITVGMEYRYHSRQDQHNRDEGVDEWNLDSRRHSRVIGVYAQDEIRVNERILLSAGLRYDHLSRGDVEGVSPRAGMIVSLSDTAVVKTLYGEAFRAPSAYEVYYHDGNVSMKENEELDREEIRTYEVVLEQELTETVYSSLSVYRYEIDDLVTQYLDPSDDLLVFANLEEVVAEGLELSLRGRIAGCIDTRFSYSYVDAHNTDTDATISNAPRNLAKLYGRIPLLNDEIFGGLELLYTDSRRDIAGRRISSYMIANATLMAARICDGFDVSLSVYNLFDEQYEYPTGEEIDAGIVAGDGRNFRLKGTWRF